MEDVRYCIVNGEEIRECMGFCLARDILDYLDRKRDNVRELSQRGVFMLERAAKEAGYGDEPWEYLDFLLQQPDSERLIRSIGERYMRKAS